MCLAGARPIDLAEVKPLAEAVLDGRGPAAAAKAGRRTEEDLLPEFVEHVVVVRRRRCAATAPGRRRHRQRHGRPRGARPCSSASACSSSRSCTASSTARSRTIPPTRCSRRTRRPAARVVAGGFDIGLAFDGDADRVFVVDETGAGLSGSTTTAILSVTTLRSHPGGDDPAQPDLLQGRARGDPRERRHPDPHQGRSLVHQATHGRDRRAVRGRALGALLLRQELRCRLRTDRHRPDPLASSRARRTCCRRCASRSSATRRAARSTPTSVDVEAVLDRVSTALADGAPGPPRRPDRRVPDSWWFNLRPSNTEPLLRLNLEAETRDECDTRVVELLALITSN